MKKCMLILVAVLIHSLAYTQADLKSTIALLQECLNLNNNNKQENIKLYEQTGVIEYFQGNIQQRIKLSDLEKVHVNANNAGFSVDIKCAQDISCINFIKNDTSNASFLGTAVQFSDMALANTFAENLSTLIIHYKTNEAPLEKKLYKNAEGKTPLLGTKKIAENKPAVKQPPVKNTPEADDEDEAGENAATDKKTAARPTRAERDEAREEKKEEMLRKKEEAKEAREERETSKKQSRKSTKKEAEADEDADNETEKATPRAKRRASKEKEEAEEEIQDEKASPAKTSKAGRNRLIEDVGDDAATGDGKAKSGNDFCGQLTAILQSGKENKFKAIEGKVTNAETKINESKIKLKGARKNYLSWYKKERAFISELKSGNDYETVFKEFESIQTTLDECLGGGWDMEDKSNSDEYAKLKTEVKDVEFKKENDETMPTIRVIFLEDNDKFTMFMRVK